MLKHEKGMTVKQLRAIAKEKGLKDYSGMNKAKLEDYVNDKFTIKKDLTKKQLLAIAKEKGLKGYTRMNKADLKNIYR